MWWDTHIYQNEKNINANKLCILLFLIAYTMILSDGTLQAMINTGELKILPGKQQTLDDIMTNIVCASMDLQLANEFKFFPTIPNHVLNPFDQDSKEITQDVYIEDWQDLIIEPGAFLLWATKERFGIPSNIVGRVEWRSSLGRLWLIIHVTAWFIDPWFGRDYPSTITLEISNINNVPIVIRPGMRICQIAFETMDQPATTPYNKKKNAKYNGQQSPQESRLHHSG